MLLTDRRGPWTRTFWRIGACGGWLLSTVTVTELDLVRETKAISGGNSRLFISVSYSVTQSTESLYLITAGQTLGSNVSHHQHETRHIDAGSKGDEGSPRSFNAYSPYYDPLSDNVATTCPITNSAVQIFLLECDRIH